VAIKPDSEWRDPHPASNTPIYPAPQSPPTSGERECPDCAGNGWYPMPDGKGGSRQEQCQWCHGEGVVAPSAPEPSERAEWEELLRLADTVVGQCDCIDGQTAADSPKAHYRKLRAALAPSQPEAAR
jgi:hypothetical protein